MIKKAKQVECIVYGLSKQKFLDTLFKNVARTSEFSHFLGDPTGTSDSEINTIRIAMASNGIPKKYIGSDRDLLIAAKIIAGRAVSLR